MLVLALGLAIFLGVHLVPASSKLHGRLEAAIGEGPYKGLFSLASLIGLGLVIWGYALARAEGPALLYEPPIWLRHVTMLLMLPVFVLALAAYLPGRISAAVHHPLITAVKTWAFAHLLSNGDTASALLFASFLAWGIVARISLKRREAAGLVRVRTGPLRNDLIALVAGLAIYAAFVARLHAWLIGVPLI
jgi:uncharacterized membrane protein